MTREEYLHYLELCRRCNEGGNDGADVYEAEEFCRSLCDKYNKPWLELLQQAEATSV